MLARITDTLGGLWVLLTLFVRSKGRLSGAYWSWRTHTAFPDGSHPKGRLGTARSALEYAAWAWRIRRLR